MHNLLLPVVISPTFADALELENQVQKNCKDKLDVQKSVYPGAVFQNPDEFRDSVLLT